MLGFRKSGHICKCIAAYGAAVAAMAAPLFSEPVHNITLELETVESSFYPGCCVTGLANVNIAPLKYLILNHEVLNHCNHDHFSLFNVHQEHMS